MGAADRRTQLAKDAAAMMRIWETAMVLSDEKGCSAIDLAKSRAKIEKLEGQLLKAETDLTDYRGKYQVFVEQVTELRETMEKLAKLQEEVESLKLKVVAEEKEKEELKSTKLPVDDEVEATRVLETRAQLIKEINALKLDALEGAKYAFDNAVAQMKVVNPGVELVVEGIGLLKQVEDGKIVVPEIYQRVANEDDEEDEDDGENQDESNVHGNVEDNV